MVFDKFIAPYVYGSDHQSRSKNSILDLTELSQLKKNLDSKITTQQHRELVDNVWLYFQRHHVLAEHSLRIKTRYFAQLLDISRLVALNE